MFGRAEWATPQSIGHSGILELTEEPSALPAMVTFVPPAELAFCQQLVASLSYRDASALPTIPRKRRNNSA